MGGRNLHNEPFDESTLTKLDLYRRYVRAWLPVFLNAPKLVVDRMQIFDFFAGPGQDEKGVSPSPRYCRRQREHRHPQRTLKNGATVCHISLLATHNFKYTNVFLAICLHILIFFDYFCTS